MRKCGIAREPPRLGERHFVAWMKQGGRDRKCPKYKSMRVQMGNLLEPGEQFLYEYDYGTTTELRLKVIDEHEGPAKGKSMRVLARNEDPLIVCNVCGKPATKVCSQCIFEDGGWLCEACGEEHECGEDMLLPVVNSPRVGMCAYEG